LSSTVGKLYILAPNTSTKAITTSGNAAVPSVFPSHRQYASIPSILRPPHLLSLLQTSPILSMHLYLPLAVSTATIPAAREVSSETNAARLMGLLHGMPRIECVGSGGPIQMSTREAC